MKKIIAWWSGGVTSAIACKAMVDLYGKDNTRMIFIDTKNEDEDTYRFLDHCQDWCDVEIETITNHRYNNINEVWDKYQSLNVATGAICSTKLKRETREDWEKVNEWDMQAFGFDLKESRRALSMSLNYPKVKAVFPLMYKGLLKKDCIEILNKVKIDIPRMYHLGFTNNNCFKTGCVQGGIGYWQKMQREFPDKFNAMAEKEHFLTNRKGQPVTVCKDQSKEAIKSGNTLVFLKKHPDYPHLKEISNMKGRIIEPLVDCNGFCGINDLI